jgi:RNA polymerase sigma factor (sigma-70 family)
MQSASKNKVGDGLEILVCAMAAGDAGALSRIYRQTVAQVYAVARGLLRSKEDAEEIVCDVYTHAWLRAGTFDASRGSVMGWLVVMARNRAVDRLRQRRELVCLDDERSGGIAGTMLIDTFGPEQMLMQFQSGRAVHRALETLSPRRRQLLGLAFFYGMSHQEIADEVGLPLGTVKSHVRRALAALQGEISP